MTAYPKMDAEIKARWVKALRSGEYVQTKGWLWRKRSEAAARLPIGNCCLGVLCRVEGVGSIDMGSVSAFLFNGYKDTRTLPPSFANIINLDFEAQNYLAVMNDNGATFPEIADWIEQNL